MHQQSFYTASLWLQPHNVEKMSWILPKLPYRGLVHHGMNGFIYHHSLFMASSTMVWIVLYTITRYTWFLFHRIHGFVYHRSLHVVLYVIVYMLLYTIICMALYAIVRYTWFCISLYMYYMVLYIIVCTVLYVIARYTWLCIPLYMVLYTITRYTCFRTPFYTWFSTPPLVMHGLVYHLYMVLYTIVYVLYAITRYTWFCIPSYTWCRTSYTCFFIPSFVTKGFTIVLLQKVSFSLCNVNPESCKRACEGQAYIPLLIVHDTSFKYMTDPVVNSYHASHKPVVFTTQGVTWWGNESS